METFNKIALLSFILLVTHFPEYVRSAKILFFGPVGTHSTRLSMYPLMEALVEKGHQVTFLSSLENFEESNKTSKITNYVPKKLKQDMGPWENHTRFFDIRKTGGIPKSWLDFQDIGIFACQSLYSDPDFVKWVKTSKFDLVIVESMYNECGFGLAHIFGTKLVVYGTSTVFPWFPDAHGLPDETSSVTDVIFNFPPGDKMTFLQRVKNALSPIVFNIKRDWTYFPVLEETTRQGLGLEKGQIPSFREIERNVSLVLLTTHFTVDLPRSLPPHVIPIGGSGVGKKNIKPMPKEILDFANSAKDGLVFISFGTITEFANFDKAVQQEFIQALNSFPKIKFLWKASIDIKGPLPKNVMLTKWVPQQTVLAHPNLKAFITNCDMGSITESVYFGIPLVLFPVFAEQDVNANAIEAKGAGIKLEITTLRKNELEVALLEILNNTKYRGNMKKLSDSFKDRPFQPIENGVWWLEYILRHENSNDYLIPLSVRQPWWKRRQIDVWLILGACIGVLFGVILLLLVLAIRMLIGSINKNNKAKFKYS